MITQRKAGEDIVIALDTPGGTIDVATLGPKGWMIIDEMGPYMTLRLAGIVPDKSVADIFAEAGFTAREARMIDAMPNLSYPPNELG